MLVSTNHFLSMTVHQDLKSFYLSSSLFLFSTPLLALYSPFILLPFVISITFLLLKHTNLTGVRPDVLQQTVLLSQSVQGVVSLTSTSDVTAQSVGGGGTSNGSALLIDVGDVDLDRSVVLGLDNSVGGRALSWDVQFNLKMLVWFICKWHARMQSYIDR